MTVVISLIFVASAFNARFLYLCGSGWSDVVLGSDIVYGPTRSSKWYILYNIYVFDKKKYNIYVLLSKFYVTN